MSPIRIYTCSPFQKVSLGRPTHRHCQLSKQPALTVCILASLQLVNCKTPASISCGALSDAGRSFVLLCSAAHVWLTWGQTHYCIVHACRRRCSVTQQVCTLYFDSAEFGWDQFDQTPCGCWHVRPIDKCCRKHLSEMLCRETRAGNNQAI